MAAKRFRKLIRRVPVVRAALSMAAWRAAGGIGAAVLWEHFLRPRGSPPAETVFALLAAVFFGLAWIAYLRLDGLKGPRVAVKRPPPKRRTGDMADHLEDDPDGDARPLLPEEKTAARLAADLAVSVLFFLLSLWLGGRG